MLITMKMDASLSGVSGLVEMLLRWGLVVYVMRKKSRPLRVFFSGNGTRVDLQELRRHNEIESIAVDAEFFRDNREDFEIARSCDQLCEISE